MILVAGLQKKKAGKSAKEKSNKKEKSSPSKLKKD
jgi:hypothetical protein